MNRIKTKTRRAIRDVIGAFVIVVVGVALLAAYFDVLTK
jgi:hypothetical protein